MDQFFVQAKTVGPMNVLKLRHDNSGQDPSWYVEKVCVEDMESMVTYEFPCDHWLAVNEGEGSIVRLLTVQG
jgi:hypothetical protein